MKVALKLLENKSLKNIRGTYFKDESGEIHKGDPQELTDVNKYMPDYSLFDEKRFYRPMGGRIFKLFQLRLIEVVHIAVSDA